MLDRNGSVRANEAGERFEYFPYGEEIVVKNPQDREKFATYTRDSVTGLDYADQRLYASAYGRFNAADPSNQGVASSPNVPGSMNRYSYTGGDPVNNVDPTDCCCKPITIFQTVICGWAAGSGLQDSGDCRIPSV